MAHLLPDFPPTDGLDYEVLKSGNIYVKYLADTGSSFLKGPKKEERKLRYCELVRAEGKAFLLTYKVKKNAHVPYFKLEILGDSKVCTDDLEEEFQFFIDDNTTAIFDVEDIPIRYDWTVALNNVIRNLRRTSASESSGDSTRSAASATPSYQHSRSRGLVPSNMDMQIGSTEPLRRGQRQNDDELRNTGKEISSPGNLSSMSLPTTGMRESHEANHTSSGGGATSGLNTPDSEIPMNNTTHHLDVPLMTGLDTKKKEKAAGKGADGQAMAGSEVDSRGRRSTPPPSTRGSAGSGGGLFSPAGIGASPRAERSTPPPAPLPQQQQRQGNAVPALQAEDLMQPSSPVMLPMRSPSKVRGDGAAAGGGLGASSPFPSPSSSHLAAEAVTGTSAGAGMGSRGHANAGASAASSSPLSTRREDGYSDHDPSPKEQDQQQQEQQQQVNMLLQEVNALSAMNDQLNEALERSESMYRAAEEDHAYQLSHLRGSLQKAMEEPASLKTELNELYDEKDAMKQSMADITHESELLAEQVGELKAAAAASQQIIHEHEATIEGFDAAYKARERREVKELQAQVREAYELVSEREAEIAELHEQLDAYAAMIRSKEQELTMDGHVEKSQEMANKRVEMEKNIQKLTQQLEQQDQEFLSGMGENMENHIQAKMAPLQETTKKLTIDLATASAAEEAERVSKVRLERVVGEQETFISELQKEITTLRKERSQFDGQAELLSEVQNRLEKSIRNHDETKQQLNMLEKVKSGLEVELVQQREALDTTMSDHQSELLQLKGQINATTMEDAHLHTELDILQRRVDLGKEQYLQVESQLHEAQRLHALDVQQHTKSTADFQESLDSANITIRDLQSQCKSLEDMLGVEQTDSKRKAAGHEEALSGLRKSHKDATAQLQSLETQAHKLELDLTAERAAKQSLEEALSTLETQLKLAQEAHIEKVNDLSGVIDQHQKTITSLRSQLQESEAQRRNSSENDSATYREMTLRLKAAEDGNKLMREELSNTKNEWKNEKEAMEARLAAQLTLQESLEHKTAESERLLATVDSDKRVLEQQYAARETELLASMTEAKTRNDSLQADLDKEKRAHSQVQRELTTVRDELEAKLQQLDRLTTTHNDLCLQQGVVEQDLAASQKALARMEEESGFTIEQLKNRIKALEREGSESQDTLRGRVQSLEDSLISTSQELKKSNNELEASQEKLQAAELRGQALEESHTSLQAEAKTMAAQLAEYSRDAAGLNKRLAELTMTVNEQREVLGEQSLRLKNEEFTAASKTQECEDAKQLLRDTEDSLRDCERELRAAEDKIHHLEDITIPSLHSNAMDDAARLKSEQSRHAAEVDALQASIEQREKAAKELHNRIEELERAEIANKQENAGLSLRLSEMVPVKDHNHRLDQLRHLTATEISELSNSKLSILSERDEAVSRMNGILQEARREAYALRRVASNIAIHVDADIAATSANGGNTVGDEGGNSAGGSGSTPLSGETGTELREMVGLVNAYAESLLADFIALRTAAVHQWFSLHSELLKGGPAKDLLSSTAGPTAASMSLAASIELSPARNAGTIGVRDSPSRGTGNSGLPTSTLGDLLTQNESMVNKLLNRERLAVTKMNRTLEDELSQKMSHEDKLADQQSTIESLEAKINNLQNSKQSMEQRYSNEVAMLQQKINQLTIDLDKRQDEYSDMIASLTKSQEEQLGRQSTHLTTVMEQKLGEQQVKHAQQMEELQDRLNRAEDGHKSELDSFDRELGTQQEQFRQIEHELIQRESDIKTLESRLDGVKAELEDKTYQLENALGQLEKAELKAANQARQRLDLERVVRRFKTPSGAGIIGSDSSQGGGVLSSSFSGGVPALGGSYAHHGSSSGRNNEIEDDSSALSYRSATAAGGGRIGIGNAATSSSGVVPSIASYSRERQQQQHHSGSANNSVQSIGSERDREATGSRSSQRGDGGGGRMHTQELLSQSSSFQRRQQQQPPQQQQMPDGTDGGHRVRSSTPESIVSTRSSQKFGTAAAMNSNGNAIATGGRVTSTPVSASVGSYQDENISSASTRRRANDTNNINAISSNSNTHTGNRFYGGDSRRFTPVTKGRSGTPDYAVNPNLSGNSAQSVSNTTIRTAYSTPNRSPENIPLQHPEPIDYRTGSSSTSIGHGIQQQVNASSSSSSSSSSNAAAKNANTYSASASSGDGNSAFNRAVLATARIEEAMKAKGWKLK